MERPKRHGKLKSILLALIAIALASCADVSSGADESETVASAQKSGTTRVSGRISDGLSHGASPRTAFPSLPDNVTTANYKVTASLVSAPAQTVEGEVNASSAPPVTFTIDLPQGEWKITVELYKTSARLPTEKLMSGENTVTITSSTPEEVTVELSYPSGSGTGTVSLEFSLDSEIAKVVTSSIPASLSKTTNASLGKFEATNVPAGSHEVTFTFCGSDGSLLYALTETVHVVSGGETNTWKSGAEYISGGKLTVTSEMIENYKRTVFYVSASGNDTTGTGGFFSPYATVKKATERIKTAAESEFEILLRSDLSSNEVIDFSSVSSAKTVTIRGYGEVRTVRAKTAASSVFKLTGKSGVSHQILFEDITITGSNGSSGSGGGIYSTDMNIILGEGVKISGNRATYGAGIYLKSGEIEISGAEISGNTATYSGSGIYIESGTVSLSGSTAVSASNDIYIDSPTTPYLTGTGAIQITGNLTGESPVATVSFPMVYCYLGTRIIKDDGTYLSSNYSKIALQDLYATLWKIGSDGCLASIFSSAMANYTPQIIPSLPMPAIKPTVRGTYLISSESDLKNLAEWSQTDSFEGFTFVLGSTITMTSAMTPIGSRTNQFKGTFNGNGFAIQNLRYDTTPSTYKGLFGHLSGTVKNLVVEGTVSGFMYVGGIAGKVYGATIDNCISNVSVTAESSIAGGIAGTGYGTFTNCMNIGNVTSSSTDAGGILGYGTTSDGSSDGKIEIYNCANYGDITASANIGGICGEMNKNDDKAENCMNVGNISSTSTSPYVGGITGSNKGTLENCYYLENSVSTGKAVANKDDTPDTNISIFSASDTSSIKTTLNEWAAAEGFSEWNYTYNGYPAFNTKM